MEKVIITGADGFVGSYTVKHFLNEGKVVLALDMGSVARRLEAHPNLTYMQCDITNTQAMLENIEHDVYDTFIHFAWAGSAGEARIDYNLQMQNALNTVECMKSWVAAVLYVLVLLWSMKLKLLSIIKEVDREWGISMEWLNTLLTACVNLLL